jgi:hypothetical protein
MPTQVSTASPTVGIFLAAAISPAVATEAACRFPPSQRRTDGPSEAERALNRRPVIRGADTFFYALAVDYDLRNPNAFRLFSSCEAKRYAATTADALPVRIFRGCQSASFRGRIDLAGWHSRLPH